MCAHTKLTVVFLMVFAAFSFAADESSSDAQQRLKERQVQRDAERAKKMTITVGQWEDLQAKVKALEAENAALKKRLAVKPAGKKVPTKIEVGMSREDILAYVEANSKKMTVTSDQSQAQAVQRGAPEGSQPQVAERIVIEVKHEARGQETYRTPIVVDLIDGKVTGYSGN